MKLRYLPLLLALLAGLLCPAWADVLWEPYDDSYYQAHQEACTVIDRVYVVPSGSSLNVYRSPEDGTILAELSEGDRIYVNQSLETPGEVWAVGYPTEDYDTQGWFRLGRLQLEYDTQQFEQDFRDTFTDYQGQLEGYQIQDTLYTWTYPGSGVQDRAFPGEDFDAASFPCQYVYTDPQGGQWGYVGYYMGSCGWVYLEDPETETPPAFPQKAENTVTETGAETIPGTFWTQGMTWAILLVVLVVAMTAGMILHTWKRSKHHPEGA